LKSSTAPVDALDEDVGNGAVGAGRVEVALGAVTGGQFGFLLRLANVQTLAHPRGNDGTRHTADFADLLVALEDVHWIDLGQLSVAADLAADFRRQHRNDAVEFAQGLQDLRAAHLREVAALRRCEHVAVVGHDAEELLLRLFVNFDALQRVAVEPVQRRADAVDFGLGGDGVVVGRLVWAKNIGSSLAC
jgi:hypothetical protein